MADLTEREREILDFAALTWRLPGAKEQAIRDRFEMSAVRYHQLLNGLIDRPEAWAYAPPTVKRLRRLREQSRAARSRLVVRSELL